MKDDELAGWMDRLLGYVRSGLPDLTNRQLAIVMIVNQTEGPHTVRGISAALRVERPVVSRALNTLCGSDLLQRARDESDRRSILIKPTSAGMAFLDALTTLDGASRTEDGAHHSESA